MKLLMEFYREELNRLPYPVLVERYHKIGGGKVKREYLASFTKEERAVISRYYQIFHRWYLVTGTPESAVMNLETWNILSRAIDFFGTV